MKRSLLLFATVLGLGCRTAGTPASGDRLAVAMTGASEDCVPMEVPGNFVAARACTSPRADGLLVRFEAQDGWRIGSLQLWAGAPATPMPRDRAGIPRPSHFPVSLESAGGVESYVFEVPGSMLGGGWQCGREIRWAAHATLFRDTGWRTTERVGSWATPPTSSDGSLWVLRERLQCPEPAPGGVLPAAAGVASRLALR